MSMKTWAQTFAIAQTIKVKMPNEATKDEIQTALNKAAIKAKWNDKPIEEMCPPYTDNANDGELDPGDRNQAFRND